MNDEQIFDAALEISSPSERTAFLDRVCAQDPVQRQRVAALLKAYDDAGSFLNKPVAEIPDLLDSHGAGAHAATHSDDHAGGTKVRLDFLSPSEIPNHLGKLGNYEIEEVIGRGGMGVVLRAVDPKLNRVVAIKVLAPELAAIPMAGKRFLREAQAAAAVSHDHVVTIHAVDDVSPVPYMVMECIIGQSLQQKIDHQGALGLKEILRIGMQMAAGLAAAHKQGLVHRDIKPANILLENGIERVKITDFGLARAVDDVGFTKTGQVTGTPQYMSPEQAMGDHIDHRSDLFSLGSVLYTMCTGRPAFRATSTVAMLRRVVDDTPRPIHEINAEIPDWLIAIIDKLMAKKPDDRFQTANEVAELLGQHLAHLQQPHRYPQPPAVARPITPRTVASKQYLTPVMWIAGGLVTAMALLFPMQALGVLRQNDLIGASNLLLTLSLLAVLGLLLVTIWQRLRQGTWRKTIFGQRPVLNLGCLAVMFLINNVIFSAWQTSPFVRLLTWEPARGRLSIEVESRQISVRVTRSDDPAATFVVTPTNGKNIQLTLLPGRYSLQSIEQGLSNPTEIMVILKAGESQSLKIPSMSGSQASAKTELDGLWKVVRMETEGSQPPSDAAPGWWEFRGHLRRELADPKTQTSECEFRLDHGQHPSQIDLIGGTDVLRQGIYELKGDELTVCLSTPPEPRPKTMTTRRNSSHFLTVLKRDDSWAAGLDSQTVASVELLESKAMKPTLGKRLAIDLNGDWDSRWGVVTFKHAAAQPDATLLPVTATYYHNSGSIQGKLNLTTGIFEGTFRENNGMNGQIRLKVGDDGQTIYGTYGYKQSGGISDPITSYDWQMTRKVPANATPVGDHVNSDNSKKSAAVINELQKLVDLAVKDHETATARYKAAQAPLIEVMQAEINLVKTRLRLVDAEGGGPKAILPLFENLVRICEEHLALTRAQYEAGVVPILQVNAAQKELAEARIRLAEIDAPQKANDKAKE